MGRLLNRLDGPMLPDEEFGDEFVPDQAIPPDATEIQYLREVEWCPPSVVAGAEADPKVAVMLHYLRERGWPESSGAIIFSQYLTPPN